MAAITSTLNTFGDTHQEIAEQGCLCVRKLASDPENRRIFGECGACEAVVKCLSNFGLADPATCEQACVAVYRCGLNHPHPICSPYRITSHHTCRLGNGSEENLVKLGNAGACSGACFADSQ